VSPGKPLATDCLPTSSRPKGSWLSGFDGLRAATQCSALSGNHRVALIRYFFILLLVPPYGGMVVYLKTLSHCSECMMVRPLWVKARGPFEDSGAPRQNFITGKLPGG